MPNHYAVIRAHFHIVSWQSGQRGTSCPPVTRLLQIRQVNLREHVHIIRQVREVSSVGQAAANYQ